MEVIGFVDKYDPNKHHRHTIRLSGWDYRGPGYYFVTICTHQRHSLFDDVDFQDIAAQALARIPEQNHARHVRLDEWVVMPNHIHVILEFIAYPILANTAPPDGTFANALVGSLGMVVGRYKTAVTTRINHLRRTSGTKVWQQGYYDRIIRNDRELQATRQYVVNNPARWAEDRDNLDNLLTKMTHHL